MKTFLKIALAVKAAQAKGVPVEVEHDDLPPAPLDIHDYTPIPKRTHPTSYRKRR